MNIARTLIVVAAVSAMAACGQTAFAPEAVTIERARIGAAPAGADAALYFDIRSGSDDRLVGVATTAASMTSLHETSEVTGGIMSSVDSVELPADAVVRLQPFGDHVMLEDLGRGLAVGDRVTITLLFEKHSAVDVEATVVDLVDLAEEDR